MTSEGRAGAGAVLAARAAAALGAIEGLGVYCAPPIRAAAPYALVEAGPESDWGHKSGTGRELRLAVTLHDRGERTERLRALAAAAEAAVAGLAGTQGGWAPGGAEGGAEGGWRLVTLVFVRGRMVAARVPGVDALNAYVVEFRARMLAG
jgi:hypothetical protein